MARNKPKITFLLLGLLVSLLTFKGRCGQVKKEMDYIMSPKAFFSSNADQLRTFLSNNAVIENLASKEAMTTSQEPPLSTSELSDEPTTSGGDETTHGTSTEPVTAKDATQWHHWGNSSYEFINTSKLTWEEATNECIVMMGEGAHLVFIDSELEDKEVSRVVNIISERYQRWWIGLTDKDSEGVWKWYNVTANYTNWGDGQPDNYGGNGENCGEILKWTYGHSYWNDNNCNSNSYFICENGSL